MNRAAEPTRTCLPGIWAEEVERLVGLGATVVSDERKPDGISWVTLADPEGNQLRVERSAAKRV